MTKACSGLSCLNCLSKWLGIGASFLPLECGLKVLSDKQNQIESLHMRRIRRRESVIPSLFKHILIFLDPYLALLSRKIALIFSSSFASDTGSTAL
ncbi:hypothetical protein FGCSD_2161 (plasmid) [Streptococcus dysgalactiae]|nr:hypothetical protein FGCSD_2161 [Streptococcus dysgalactiae]